MTSSDPRSIDAQLSAALHHRTARGDADLDGLWRAIVRSAEQTPQARAIRWPRLTSGRRPWLLAAAGLLLVGSVGLAAVVTGAIRLDGMTAVRPHNGPILVAGEVDWALLDPADGTQLPNDGIGRLSRTVGMPIDFSWSRDGRRMAFTSRTGAFVRDLASGRSWPVGTCSGAIDCGVALSPDGSRIAISSGRRLDVYEADGSGATEVVELPPGRYLGGPTWSPDGTWIAYVDDAYMHLGVALRAVHPDGTGDHLVALPPDPESIGFQDPAWTADSQRVVYLGTDAWDVEPIHPSGRGNSGNPGWELRIMAVPVTGTSAVPSVVAVVGRCYCLGFSPSFDVAPDGSAYVVSTLAMPLPGAAAPKDGLFVIDATTLQARYLGDGTGTTVAWRPAP